MSSDNPAELLTFKIGNFEDGKSFVETNSFDLLGAAEAPTYSDMTGAVMGLREMESCCNFMEHALMRCCVLSVQR